MSMMMNKDQDGWWVCNYKARLVFETFGIIFDWLIFDIFSLIYKHRIDSFDIIKNCA